MSKVKLELQRKNFTQLSSYANTHRSAMDLNINFLDPIPSVLIFDGALTPFDNKIKEIADTELALEVMRSQRDEMRVELEIQINARGNYVETISKGEASVILSAAMEVQAASTTTTSIDKPIGLYATMGPNDGEISVGCQAVYKGQGYIFERRDHSDTAAPGPWGDQKFATRSTGSYSGLVSGKKYSFRMRALGPNGLESPWSDEVICMAP